MKRRDFLKSVSGLAAGVMAPAPAIWSAAKADARSETLLIVSEGGPNNLDIHGVGTNVPGYEVSWNCYDRLISHEMKSGPGGVPYYDRDKFKPELAEDMNVGDMSVTFKLKKNAKFHDGAPVTAKDVKWSLDRAVSVGGFPTFQMSAGSLTKPEQFVIVDDNTVRVDFARKDRLTIPDLAVIVPCVVNSELVKKNASEKDPWGLEYTKQQTAGSGAYRVTKWTAGACGLLFCIFEAPRVLLAGVLLHQFRIDHAGHDHGEIGDRQAILLGKVHPHGVVVDDDERLGFCEGAGAHLEGRESADADGTVQRPLDVLGRHRRAVVKFCVLLQFEGHRHVADIHVFGEFGLELVAVVIRHAAGTAFHLVADQAIVAIPRHFIAGHVGADAVDVEIVGAAFRDDQQRLRAGIGLGGGPDRGRGRHDAGGQSGDGFQEIATLHVILHTQRGQVFGATSQGSCQILTQA